MTVIVLESVGILLLITLNGMLALSEIAIVSARSIRLQQMAARGIRGAAVALELKESPTRFLSTVQAGITLVGIFAGAVGGATLSRSLAEFLTRFPLLRPYADAVGLVLVVGTITFLTVVFGELVPKRIAMTNSEAAAATVARPMRALSRLTWPLVRLLGRTTDAVVRLLRLDEAPGAELTEEEIRKLLEQGARVGVIDPVEHEMVESVFELDERPLETIMTPRSRIAWLDVNASPAEIRRVVARTAHSRFPVCDGDLDRVVGLVRARDLLAGALGKEEINLRAAIQQPLFVPEFTPVTQVLDRMRETGIHLAMLIDEYGGIEGIVTAFDLLQAIVGDIPTRDEIDRPPPIVQRDDGSYLVDGRMPIDEFQSAFEIHAMPEEGRYQTLGGFVIFMLGSLPAPGHHFDYGGFRIEVVDMDGRRVDKVLLERLPEPKGSPADGDS